MFIYTENLTTDNVSASAFDTNTGIRYTLFFSKSLRRYEQIHLNIESAHTAASENMFSGLTYRDTEAIDFWLSFADTAPGLNGDKLYHIGKMAANAIDLRQENIANEDASAKDLRPEFVDDLPF